MNQITARLLIALVTTIALLSSRGAAAEPLLAGVARIDITNRQGRVNDPSYAKALVLRQGDVTVVLVTVDAVAIGGIGNIRDTFLGSVRQELAKDPGILPANLIVNASHCHGNVRSDSAKLVVQIVREAVQKLTPVKVGTGTSQEKRISENRRVTLKDGSQVDLRRAYSLAWDKEIASIGPIDPQVGLLRLDREDGRPLAVLYNFACHPIMNPPSKGTSADFPAYASALLENALGDGVMAFFVQGCGGDINPVRYKEVQRAPDAEPLGNLLGASVLDGLRKVATATGGKLSVKHQVVSIPRAADFERRIGALEAERLRIVQSLRSTNINFKSFLPLLIQQRLDPEFPAVHRQGYLHDRKIERDELDRQDVTNRSEVEAYLANIQIMEQLTRLNTNLALLKKNKAMTDAAAVRTLDVEMCALRVGDFKLVTFPGEVTVEVGLNIKQAVQDPHAFVAGYTNGYIFYTPTVQQRNNTGYAQEDCDCIVAPEWQKIFETNALEMLRGL